MAKKFVLLDRDGTLIKYIPYLNSPKKVELLKSTIPALKKLKRLGFLFGIITNQSIINRGMSTALEVDSVNLQLLNLLSQQSIKIEFVSYCPHTPEEGCACRKPRTLLGTKAIYQYKIDASLSYMIGDTMTDVEFGKNLGLKTIRLKSDFPICNNAHYNADDLIDAAHWIERDRFN
jgi:histidinol-phosphate phosphatase family protein